MAEEALTLEQQQALALARARLRAAAAKPKAAAPAPESSGAAGQYAGVINRAVAPYALAAGGGAAVGGPFGAVAAPLALGATDLTATLYNLGAGALGSENRLPVPSDVVRQGLTSVAPNVFREPTTSGQRYLAAGAEAATSAGTAANALLKLASKTAPGTTQNVLRELGRAPATQTGAAVGAATAPQAVSDFTEEGSVLDNPYVYGVASVLGGVLGGAGTAKALNVGGVRAPTLPKMKAQAAQAYADVDASGVAFDPAAYDGFLSGVRGRLTGFDPDQHRAVDFEIRQLEQSAGQARTISELDTARSNIKKRLGKSTDPNIRRLGSELADEIDDFVLNAPPSSVMSGSYPDAVASLQQARQLYAAVSKSERMEELLRRAKLSRQPLDDAVRREFLNVARNPRQMRLFTPEERQFIEQVAQGGKLAASLTSFGESLRVRSVLGGGLYAGAGVGMYLPQVDAKTAAAVALGVGATGSVARRTANALATQRAQQAAFEMRGGRKWQMPPLSIGLGTATGAANAPFVSPEAETLNRLGL